MSPDEREEKLPAWARNALADERKRADIAERKLAEHLETVQQTPIWYGLSVDNPIYVPDDRISYALSDDRLSRIDVTLHRFRNSTKPFLRVSAHGQIRVNPRSSNGIDIYMEDQ